MVVLFSSFLAGVVEYLVSRLKREGGVRHAVDVIVPPPRGNIKKTA